MVLKEERAAAASERSVSHDRHTVSEQVGLVHEVGRQHDNASFAVLADKIPRETAAVMRYDTIWYCTA